MPPPSSENDLKRLARRRLIGAVALTLLAVIALPLLLEDEPPPTSALSVHMAEAPAPVQAAAPVSAAEPASSTPSQPAPPAEPAKAEPEPAKPAARPEPKPEAEPVKPEPVKAEPAKPQSKPHPVAAPVPQKKPAAASEMFVVQLAALSDGAKARELKARAALAGLPTYTDTVGSLTRVRVGPYPTREAAEAAAGRLAENGMTGQVLAK
ncbi:SPOR domain-containing protein [Thiobacillus sp.]|uniref:SPOR domain-containing protein n=1 Tax=Thiobacillus sp. TaxID=924 RepID=UPI0017CCA1C3|nr:SPOR domain-containing protein [Thiobacillus sp.]MBC2730906.1 SPOR domain-containing protein [Thiobacillus sp.]MBC2739643.1 SPOR domain-containing protein [Thiobacillus sp.]MBC2760075.1 SPOR domain-containing protein [Thiobacillus sp.]MBD3812325.1 SPOR domain-containing protein [Betaproteobacteria bacterium]